MPHRAQAILNSIPSLVSRFGRDRRFEYVNQAAADHFGRPAGEVVGRTLVELGATPEDAGRLWATLERVFDEVMPVEFEHPATVGHRDRWFLSRVMPEAGDDGVVRTALAVTTDITELKATQGALRASEERFRLATAAAAVGIWEWDLRTGQIYWNAQMFDLYQVPPTPDGLVSYDTWSGAVVPEDLAHQEAVLRDTVGRQGSSSRAFRIRRPGGDIRHVEAAEAVRANARGQAEWVIGTNVDVTDRKRAEDQLRASEGRLRAFMTHTPAVAWIKGPDGRTQLVSRKMAELFGGAERWVGKTDHEVLPQEVADVTAGHDRTVRETGVPMEIVEEVPTSDGQLRPWLVVKFPIPTPDGSVGTGGIALDLTERRRAEEERRKAEQRLYESLKLESLGVLAGGIAHDFNNLLTSMLGYASLAGMELSAGRGAALPAYLGHIETAAGRAADLCKQMLAYAGKGQFQVKPVSLNKLVEEMAQLLQASISKKAVLRLMPTADQPTVTCDTTQIRQVVLNLITNASDAIGDRSGVISVATGVVDADATYLRDVGAPHLAPGRYAYLEVSDTGCGMSAGTVARMFEPFYTTKPTGRGLGLSAIQGIVRSHLGAVKVYSEVGRGTTFKILLPTTDQTPARESAAQPVGGMSGRGRLVLVIDDEEDIRVFIRKALERHGFGVALAADGRAGEAEYRARRPEIDLVLCDLTMPHQDGGTTFRKLRQFDPEAKVVLMSGFSADDATAGLNGMGLQGFLRKPFRVEELSAAVFAAVGR